MFQATTNQQQEEVTIGTTQTNQGQVSVINQQIQLMTGDLREVLVVVVVVVTGGTKIPISLVHQILEGISEEILQMMAVENSTEIKEMEHQILSGKISSLILVLVEKLLILVVITGVIKELEIVLMLNHV
jgi:restriction endonuclease